MAAERTTQLLPALEAGVQRQEKSVENLSAVKDEVAATACASASKRRVNARPLPDAFAR